VSYEEFLSRRFQSDDYDGFDCDDLPDCLFDFQRDLVAWALLVGKAAIFADCGMGKTIMELVFAQKVIERLSKPALLLTPIAVGHQVVKEGEKFGIECARSRDGKWSGNRVIVSNYEQLHKFNPDDFCAVICDESSSIKNFKSQRKTEVVDFMRQTPFRLLATATAAPNDFWELGTSSEALGVMGFRDMITKFFKQETSNDGIAWGRTKYRFRGHAERPFWSWVCSWARAVRSPADLGYDASNFILPELREHELVVTTKKARDGMLFAMPARSLQEQRQERRNSITERCEMAAEIAHSKDAPCVVWCELNDEGDMLEQVIEGSVQVKGSMSDDAKENALQAFADGQIKYLITKPKIGCWGLNWQHCSDVVVFPSHSFEQYYQAVRRCWRFGQKNPVDVSLIVNEGEIGVLKNIRRKAEQSDEMFSRLVELMNDPLNLVKRDVFPNEEEVPQWLA
jgi:hypothetical protein